VILYVCVLRPARGLDYQFVTYVNNLDVITISELISHCEKMRSLISRFLFLNATAVKVLHDLTWNELKITPHAPPDTDISAYLQLNHFIYFDGWNRLSLASLAI